jgi:Trypsin
MLEFRARSGGPLLTPSGVLVGVTSFIMGSSQDCGTGIDGSVRVSAYNDWIQETICGLSDNPPVGCVLPPDWPVVSPWVPPCGRQDCAGLFGPGVRLRGILNFFLFSFPVEWCFTFWVEFFLSNGWTCVFGSD